MKRVSLKNEKKKGFTLVELIIVIAIIAILAAIAIPKFGEMRQTANVKADIATAKNIATIVAEGIADNTIAINTSGQTIAATDSKIAGKLDGGVTTAKVAEGTSDFNAKIDKDGNIKVLIGSTEIYPSSSASTNHK